jgi:hypothetical protein
MTTKNKKQDEFGNKICDGHSMGFSRIHERIDSHDKMINQIDIFLFGNPERNVTGFVQKDSDWKTRMDVYMKIIIFIGSVLVLAAVPLLVKTFWPVVK